MDKKSVMQTVAGGGLLDRRLFMKKGLVFSIAAMTADSMAASEHEKSRQPWMRKPGQPFSNYGQPSPHERRTIRWVMANSMAPGNGVSWTPLHDLEGTITPSGLHFERHHNGVPQIDPQHHSLLLHGLVNKPLLFSMEDLLRYPMSSQLCFIECGGNSNAGWRSEPIQTAVGYFHGMASCSEWTGVPLRILLEEAKVKGRAKWLIAEGADAAVMNVSIPLEKALDDCILALYQNGERIRPENGYPLRLIVPGWEGVTHVKWLRRLHLTNRPTMARNETAKYTDLLPDGKARQFSFVMEAKSLITNPSFGHRLERPGLYQISGLAWSGRGRIAKVEVSADGGKSWAEAELQAPVLAKCFTRFRIPWQWNGQKTVLKSRAIDESGYIQPERDALIEQRGRHGYFHYNAIVSWEVSERGEVSHVYA
ncbi:sulfite dehydrogenase [Methylomarinum vadi]|uniref:sulfite dehydrogenase n=1 Tax=Methylomarinum vadi TaxID=438855 RepID=UPI0004DF8738|nr:sulfite dehydrogenase [Methylomarinum vadi]